MQRELFEEKENAFICWTPDVYILQGAGRRNMNRRSCWTAAASRTSEARRLGKYERVGTVCGSGSDEGKESYAFVRLPQDLNKCKRLKIYALRGNEKILWFSIAVRDLVGRREAILLY